MKKNSEPGNRWYSTFASKTALRIGFGVQQLIFTTLTLALFSRRKGKPSRIMLLRSSRFGDFVNAIPAFAALRSSFPDAEIVAIIVPSTDAKSATKTPDTSYTDLLEPGLVDRFLTVRFQRGFDWKAISEVRQVVREFQPDMFLVLPFSAERLGNRIRKLLFLKLVGIRHNAYGLKPRSVSFGFMRGLQHKAGLIEHQVLGPLNALHEIGVPGGPVRFPIRRDPQAARRAEAIWNDNRLSDKTVVALFPGATFEHKRWPLENFQELCRSLLADQTVSVAVLGGSGETGLSSALCAKFPSRVISLAGGLSFLELAEVLRRCALFVGNDSGPGHLAAAVGCPTVTLFSAIEYPGFWEPWNSRHLAIRKHVSCEYCFSYHKCPTGTSECIRSITTDEVFALVRTQLGNQTRKTFVE